jgi:hypothetical protein
LVIRYVRQWYGVRRKFDAVDWELNIGVPSTSLDDATANRFRELAKASWVLAVSGEPITPEAAARVGNDADIPIDAYPEVIAAVSAYLRSSDVQDGVHALVDIGAGTVDIAVFNFERLVDRIPIIDRAVVPLGTRFMGLDVDGREASAFEAEAASFENRAFSERVANHVLECLKRTKFDGASIETQLKHRGIPIFITGGGAGLRVFNKDMRYSVKSREGYFNWKNIAPKALPPLQDPKGDPIDPRLNSAVGLSHRRDDLPEVQPHSETRRIETRRKPEEVSLARRDFFDGEG